MKITRIFIRISHSSSTVVHIESIYVLGHAQGKLRRFYPSLLNSFISLPSRCITEFLLEYATYSAFTESRGSNLYAYLTCTMTLQWPALAGTSLPIPERWKFPHSLSGREIYTRNHKLRAQPAPPPAALSRIVF